MRYKSVPIEVRTVSAVGGAGETEMIASTRDQDLDGDILEPKGAILDEFKRNPIVLFQHNPNEFIGTCTSLFVTDQDIRGQKGFAAQVEFWRALVGIERLPQRQVVHGVRTEDELFAA